MNNNFNLKQFLAEGKLLKEETEEINIENQIQLLKKYKISKYSVENGRIIINGKPGLKNLESIPDSDLLSNVTINGDLVLESLKSIPDSNFLSGTVVNGDIFFDSLKSIPDSNFLSNTTVNGGLYLSGLIDIPDSDFLLNTKLKGGLWLSRLESIPDSNFLSDRTINGNLDLWSLKSIPDSNFLSGTVIKGGLYLRSLEETPDSNFLSNTTVDGDIFFNKNYPPAKSNTVAAIDANTDSIPLSPEIKDYIDNTIQNAKDDGEFDYLLDVGFFGTDLADNILTEFMDEYPNAYTLSQEVEDYIDSQL
jgi:hypothetical protein